MAYLDENGNIIPESSSNSGKVNYLDNNGNVITQVQPPSAQEQFIQKYNASVQRSAPEKIKDSLSSLISGLYGTVKGGVEGTTNVLSDAIKKAQSNNALSALNVVPLRGGVGLGTAIAAAPDLVQTGADSVARMLTDAYDAGKPLGAYISDIVEGRAQPPSLLSRTPTSGEGRAAFERSQFAQTEARPEGAILPEVVGKTNVPLSKSLQLLVGEEAVLPQFGKRGAINAATEIAADVASGTGRGLSTVKSRGLLSKPFEDVLTKTTGITAQEGSLDLAATAVPRIKETLKGVPGSANDVVQAAKTTGKKLLDKTDSALKVAEDRGLEMDKNLLQKNAEEVLNRDEFSLITPDEKLKVLENVLGKFPEKIPPTRGKRFLIAQNAELDRFHEGTQSARRKVRGDPTVAVELAVTRSLSDQLDDLYKLGSGLDESPYRDYGSVKEFSESINDQIIKAQKAQGKAGSSITGGPSFSKPGMVVGAVKAIPVGRALVSREIEAIDSGARRIWKDIPEASKPSAISQEFIDSRSPIYGGFQAPPVIP